MKTSELTGALLDYWVAQASPQFSDITFETREDCIACLADSDGEKFVAAFIHGGNVLATMRLRRKYQHAICFSPSTDWSQGGSIIERERIQLSAPPSGEWIGVTYVKGKLIAPEAETPLVAAMRAYVASKFGDEVPDERAASTQDWHLPRQLAGGSYR